MPETLLSTQSLRVLVSTYAAVLFDLDGTLCRHEQEIAAVWEGAFADSGIEPFGEPPELWATMEEITEYESEQAQLADGFASMAAAHGRDVDIHAWVEAFVSRLDWTQVSLLSGATAALKAARRLGAVGLVTNGPESRQSTKLAALGLTEAFDTIVYAGDMARRKPHPEPFDRALDALGAKPERTLYVGNSLEHDVAGARNAGLPVAWIDHDGTGAGEYAPDHVLRSVADLPPIL